MQVVERKLRGIGRVRVSWTVDVLQDLFIVRVDKLNPRARRPRGVTMAGPYRGSVTATLRYLRTWCYRRLRG